MVKAQRNPRFKRVALKNKTQLTERDRKILSTVENHKFIRSSQIVDLVGGSRQQILRRLQRLFHLGHIDRPRSQIDYFHEGGGSREMVYSVPGKQVQRFYLQHALMTSDIAVAFERACQTTPTLRLAYESEIAAELNAIGDGGDDPFQWHVDVTRQLRVGVRPDRVLQIGSSNDSFGMHRATFFIEADRGTMPIERASLEQTSILRKLLAYHSTWAQGLHRSLFKIDRFRVLIVTGDKTRVGNMVEACQRIERARRLFLFVDYRTVLDAANIFEVPLVNGNGEIDSLGRSFDLN